MALDFQNLANVILQNRTTGQLEEEKMQMYVSRLLYKGFLSEIESELGMACLYVIHSFSKAICSSRV